MSKRVYIARYSLLLRRLQLKNYPNWPEIQTYVERELDLLRLQDDRIVPDYSKRTFDRDKSDLRETFGINISYSASQKGYFIEEDAYQNQSFERVMEAFDVFNALKISRDVSPFIHLEQRKPQGTEHLYGILHALKNKLEIRFTYGKFWEEEKSTRLVAPHGLKEYRNRWYILAEDRKDQKLKTFALDRLSDLEITNHRIGSRNPVNVEDYFRHSFGVIGSKGEPEEVILSFTPFQGKYIRSLPLHHSQEILTDNDEELRVRLKLQLTYDFRMELLSFGDQVRVVSPVNLQKEVQEIHHNAANLY